MGIESDLNKLFDVLGIDNSTLNSTEQALLVNRTTDLASVPIPGLNNLTVTVSLHNQTVGQPLTLEAADDFGEIDQFSVVAGLGALAGNGTQINQTMVAQLYAQNVTGPGNSSVILVPDSGISVVSDVSTEQQCTK